MVFEEQTCAYESYNGAFNSTDSLVETNSKAIHKGGELGAGCNGNQEDVRLISFKMPYQQSFKATPNWLQLAEPTLPLKPSAMSGSASSENYGSIVNGLSACTNHEAGYLPMMPARGRSSQTLEMSTEFRSKEISRKLILVNLLSLLTNLLLAIVAFYFSFTNNSSATTAFAADCVLDFLSSAIVLWRYHGDLSDVYMQAREQIACIYLGALFEISAVGIIIKASSDIASGAVVGEVAPGYDLLYLAAAATIACSVLIVFKLSLYRTIKDKSILLDVINTFISTIFAITLCLMTVLSNADSSFWYFDPLLSMILALFMAGFGIKVIHQNFNILRPNHQNSQSIPGRPLAKLPALNKGGSAQGLGKPESGKYEVNLSTSLERSQANWQKVDYSAIKFV